MAKKKWFGLAAAGAAVAAALGVMAKKMRGDSSSDTAEAADPDSVEPEATHAEEQE